MSKEEAIKYLKEMKDECNDTIHKVRYVTKEEVLDMAIKALEKEPCKVSEYDKDHIWYKGWQYISLRRFLEVKAEAEQEPSGDLISRQAVIDACEQSINILEAVDRIMDLPSVEQEPKTGHWIDDTKYGGTECSECGKWYPHATIAKNEIKYCSECGARMESEGI